MKNGSQVVDIDKTSIHQVHSAISWVGPKNRVIRLAAAKDSHVTPRRLNPVHPQYSLVTTSRNFSFYNATLTNLAVFPLSEADAQALPASEVQLRNEQAQRFLSSSDQSRTYKTSLIIYDNKGAIRSGLESPVLTFGNFKINTGRSVDDSRTPQLSIDLSRCKPEVVKTQAINPRFTAAYDKFYTVSADHSSKLMLSPLSSVEDKEFATAVTGAMDRHGLKKISEIECKIDRQNLSIKMTVVGNKQLGKFTIGYDFENYYGKNRVQFQFEGTQGIAMAASNPGFSFIDLGVEAAKTKCLSGDSGACYGFGQYLMVPYISWIGFQDRIPVFAIDKFRDSVGPLSAIEYLTCSYK